jgi:hypothetical protein
MDFHDAAPRLCDAGECRDAAAPRCRDAAMPRSVVTRQQASRRWANARFAVRDIDTFRVRV